MVGYAYLYTHLVFASEEIDTKYRRDMDCDLEHETHSRERSERKVQFISQCIWEFIISAIISMSKWTALFTKTCLITVVPVWSGTSLNMLSALKSTSRSFFSFYCIFQFFFNYYDLLVFVIRLCYRYVFWDVWLSVFIEMLYRDW